MLGTGRITCNVAGLIWRIKPREFVTMGCTNIRRRGMDREHVIPIVPNCRTFQAATLRVGLYYLSGDTPRCGAMTCIHGRLTEYLFPPVCCQLSVTTSTKRSGGASGPPRVGGRPSKSRSRFLLPISSRQIDESIISMRSLGYELCERSDG